MTSPAAGGPLRVAVVGAGPAGIYVADSLTKKEPGTEVDVYDRLPAPFGLLRYGVAPDHLKMKNLAGTLQKVIENPTVRFFGNVELGRDLTTTELLADYHAVVYTVGASTDRPMGIPGEHLPGSIAATDFVAWYCGHPDAETQPVQLDSQHAAVIGLGNVALDVARILIRNPEELSPTDVPDTVLDALRASQIRDVHIVGRRGPEHVKFTLKELREMGELDGVDVIVDPAHFADIPDELEKNLQKMVDEMRSWSTRERTGAERRLHLHFYAPPQEVLGTDRVEGLRIKAGDGSEDLPVGLVFRSIGYLGVPVPGVPFDEANKVVPTADHRVVGGQVEIGEYAAGWVKRGATGVIGTNRSDADHTVEVILGDRDQLLAREVSPGTALELVRSRVAKLVELENWNSLDAAEKALGEKRGNAARVKVHTWAGMLEAAGHTLD
ncbi:FAD-dependent oxidoreductase [Sporichthya brevicatena]|uniref:FAD-dependent oxidoreductase n=1 Tax=Sporichthya brevicatena TaxID=171442 RepID=UPI0031D03DDC